MQDRIFRSGLILGLTLFFAPACDRSGGGGANARSGSAESSTSAAAAPDTNPVDGTVTVDTQAMPAVDSAAGR